MATKKEKTAAVVTVYDLNKMTVAGRKKIAKWLRSRANVVEKHGDLYAKRFTQRYLYT